MKIILKKLVLQNFKGIRDLEVDFKKSTTIRGDNATGKTTIFDAYCWLLFDKDSLNRSDFEIKTYIHGETAHNLEHSVVGDFIIDDQEVTFKKVYKEKWTRKRGNASPEFTGHTTDYFMNDVPVKKKDYSDRIGHFIGENEFALLSNPLYFNVFLDRKARRKILMDLSDPVSDLEIIAQHENLKDLQPELESLSIEEVMAKWKASTKKMNEQLKSLPVRIDELRKGIQIVDVSELKAQEKFLSEQLQQIDEQILDVDVSSEIKELNDKIFALQKEMSEKKLAVQMHNADLKHRYAIEKNEWETALNDADFRLSKKRNLLEEKKKNFSENENLVESLREEFCEVSKESFVSSGICPTCQQPLPPSMLEDEKALFYQQKSERLEKITSRGRQYAERGEREKEQIQQLEADCDDLLQEIQKLQDMKIEMPEMVEVDTSDLEDEILSFSKKRDGFQSSDNRRLMEEKRELQQQLSAVQDRLSAEKNNANLWKRISEYEAEEKRVMKDYEQGEKVLFLCDEFLKIKLDAISDSINEQFHIAKFKLFDRQVNGGISETCEATMNGIPYSDLNNAMKINVGLDVINTLSKKYEKSVPIFVDNAESVNYLYKTDSQLIRLVVSKDRELVLEGE